MKKLFTLTINKPSETTNKIVYSVLDLLNELEHCVIATEGKIEVFLKEKPICVAPVTEEMDNPILRFEEINNRPDDY